MYRMKLQCPRCKSVWNIGNMTPGVMCNCHLYCSEGSKPNDCSVQEVDWSGDFGWPAGIHTESENEGDDVRHRVRLCSTHGNYIYKVPVFLEADWGAYLKESKRLPKKHRFIKH